MVSLALLAFSAGLAGCTDPGSAAPAGPPSPSQDVELVVDDLGITHVYAQTDADAFFGSGYAMARDRLLQMELMRRRALGRRAELLGGAYVSDDAVARTMNFPKLARADQARVQAEHPTDAALLDAWTAGVNRRIAEVRGGAAPRPYGMRETELDFVPEPWETWEAYAVGKLLSFGLGNSLDRDILATALTRLAPEASERFPALLASFDIYPAKPGGAPPPGPAPGPFGPGYAKAVVDPALFPAHYRPIMPETASNNWAVAGEHTTSGRPFVCGDPHQDLTSPTRFWPVHMNSAAAGGTLDVAGFAFVGTPTVQLGHNAHLGWTATTNFADVMDLWDVPLDPSFDSVTLGGQTVKLVTREEVIRVKAEGGKVGDFVDDVVFEVSEVPGYGVILPDLMLPVNRAIIADGLLLFQWTGFEPTTESIAYLSIDRARNIDEFEAAADLLEVGAVNFIAADAQEIDWYVHARVPDRGDPSARPMPWRVQKNYDDPGSFWSGKFLSGEQIPHLRAPADGVLFTANTDPFGFTADGVVENDPFYYGAFYANGARAQRIQVRLGEMLGGGGKVDRAAMEEMQRDVHGPLADTVVPLLEKAIADIGVDPKLAQYVGRDDLKALGARLIAWDRRHARDQAEPVIYNALTWFAAKRAFEPAVSATLFAPIAEASPPFFLGQLHNVLAHRFADAPTFMPEGPSVLLLQALDDTTAWIKTRFGAADAKFKMADVHGALFKTEFGGELAVEPMSVDGSVDTINVSPAPFFDGDAPRAEFASTEMALYRMVVGFAEDGTPEATVNFARGTSGEPGSLHFGDQDAAWASVTYAPLAFRRSEVDARTESREVIGAGK